MSTIMTKRTMVLTIGLTIVVVAMLLARRSSSSVGVEAAIADATNPKYVPVVDWLKLPEGRPEPDGLQRHIGNMHGDIAVSSNNDVYLSVQALDKNNQPLPENYHDRLAGLQVYNSEGKYLRNLPGAPTNLHGFIINREQDGEFIYGVRLATTSALEDQARAGLEKQAIVKMTLTGDVVLAIPGSAIPDEFKNKDAKDGHPYLRLTGLAVAPNGDIYATDGYASDYIHRFDRTGKYLKSFGGKAAPYDFKTLHKLAIDTRFSPARIIACDRANNRVVHLSLDGDFLGVVATDLKLPAAIAVRGDYAVVGELQGRMTVLDKSGHVVQTFGTNTAGDEIGSKLVDPAKWRSGIVVAPHGLAFNDRGDVFVSEINIFGRVDRFDLQDASFR
jgi:hypothetical protein